MLYVVPFCVFVTPLRGIRVHLKKVLALHLLVHVLLTPSICYHMVHDARYPYKPASSLLSAVLLEIL